MVSICLNYNFPPMSQPPQVSIFSSIHGLILPCHLGLLCTTSSTTGPFSCLRTTRTTRCARLRSVRTASRGSSQRRALAPSTCGISLRKCGSLHSRRAPLRTLPHPYLTIPYPTPTPLPPHSHSPLTPRFRSSKPSGGGYHHRSACCMVRWRAAGHPRRSGSLYGALMRWSTNRNPTPSRPPEIPSRTHSDTQSRTRREETHSHVKP